MSDLIRRAGLVSCALALSLMSLQALCWQSGPETHPGPEEARFGPGSAQSPIAWGWYPSQTDFTTPNEHAKLLYNAMERAGLPGRLLATPDYPFTVSVFTGTATIPNLGISTAIPSPLSGPTAATAKVDRVYTIAGFAGLPDHSYSLADWIAGNEVCPPGTTIDANTTASECHNFASHMGPLNSTHFLPQAESIYAWYHGLALSRARECKALADGFRASPLYGDAAVKGRLDEMSVECEREALSLEAVGQHFLQDAWAVGHMWERWGYPTFPQFPKTLSGLEEERQVRAVGVALISGLIHGSEAKTDVPDEMSAGNQASWAMPNDPTIDFGIGDLHLEELFQYPKYYVQSQYLLDCSASGLREVYSATGRVSGALSPGSIEIVRDPVSDCFGQRATNRSIYRGLGITCTDSFLEDASPIQRALCVLQMTPEVAALLQVVPSSFSLVTIPVAAELIAVSVNAAIRSRRAPDATDLATSGLLPPFMSTLLDVEKNHAAIASLPAPYADPPLPWPGGATGSSQWVPARWLARAFNKAHVKDFCGDSEAAPYALLLEVEQASPERRPIACEICTEFVSRQMRVNGNPSICDAAGVSTQSIPGTASADVAAQAFCGCDPETIREEWIQLSNEATGNAQQLDNGITEYSCSNRQVHEFSRFRGGNLEQRFNLELVYSQRAGAYEDYETVLYVSMLPPDTYLGSSSITELLDGNINTASGGLGGFNGEPTITTLDGRPAYAIRYPWVDDDIPAVVSFYCNPLTGRGFCSANPRFVVSCDLPGWP